MPTKRVNLTDRYAKYIQRAVTQGRFADTSQAVNAAIGVLEEQDKQNQAKLKNLRNLVKQGFDQIDQGNYEVVTPENFDEFMASLSAVNRRRKSE